MDERNYLDILKILKHIKREENFRLALMDKEERIAYIVAQMEQIESNFPEIVEYCEPADNIREQ